MDTDPNLYFDEIVSVCASSKYSIEELEKIFWNEIEPAVAVNLWDVAGEWRGYELEGLTALVLKKHRYGKCLPIRQFRPYATGWWNRLREAVVAYRNGES